MRRSTAAIFFLLVAGYLGHAEAREPVSMVGVVTEKPASGWFVEHDGKYLVPYTQQIPGTDVRFEMIPVPGGVAEVGVGADVAADDAEQPVSPRIRVKLPPYWVSAHEATWAQYWGYMDLYRSFSQIAQLRQIAAEGEGEPLAEVLAGQAALLQLVTSDAEPLDAITSPTPLYDADTTYESGKEPDLPAVTISVYAAKQYSKWLSTICGVEYRLPSEAEWEHAARAGGEGAFGAGAEGETISMDNLEEYAWTIDNADYATHTVGSLKPNAWGLHDMLGNAAEWVLDVQTGEATPAGEGAKAWAEAITWPTDDAPRIAKGGYWDAEAADCRIATRMPSEEEEWKLSDPNIPTSPWWYADYPSGGIGFRLVRQLAPMDDEQRQRVWEIDNDTLREDIATRLEEGRGKAGKVVPEMQEVVEQLKSRAVDKLLN